jgi:hypothetical protein
MDTQAVICRKLGYLEREVIILCKECYHYAEGSLHSSLASHSLWCRQVAVHY